MKNPRHRWELRLEAWAVAVSVALAACEPLPADFSKPGDGGPPPVKPLPSDGGGGQGAPPSDGGVPPLDAGRPDTGISEWSPCTNGWQSQELAREITSPAFALDSAGNALYAYDRYGQLAVASSAPGTLPVETGWYGLNKPVGMEVDARGVAQLVSSARASSAGPMAVYAASNATGPWQRRELTLGNALSFDLDAQGFTHILYTREDQGNRLWYGHDRLGAWTSVDLGVVVATALQGAAQVRVDGQGHAHVAYVEQQSRRVRYATNASGAWVHEDVGNQAGWSTALALDSEGVPHVATSGLWYAARRQGRWEVAFESNDLEVYLALFVDAQGQAHLAGINGARTHELYLTRANESWHAVTVAALPAPVGVAYAGQQFTEQDAQGRTHIAWLYGVYTDADGHTGTRFLHARQCP